MNLTVAVISPDPPQSLVNVQPKPEHKMKKKKTILIINREGCQSFPVHSAKVI